MLGHAMVIHPIRLVLCDHDSLVGWLVMFTCFLCCDSNLPFLSSRTVICLLLRNAGLPGRFDCLLVDDYFLL